MSSFRLRLLNVDGASRNSLGVRRVKAERCGCVIGMQISAMLLCDEKADELENRREGRPLPKGKVCVDILEDVWIPQSMIPWARGSVCGLVRLS